MQPYPGYVSVHYLRLKCDTRNLPRAISYRIRERTRLPVASRRAGICQGLMRKSVLIVNRSTGSRDKLRIFPPIMRRETIRGVFPFFFFSLSFLLAHSVCFLTVRQSSRNFLRGYRIEDGLTKTSDCCTPCAAIVLCNYPWAIRTWLMTFRRLYGR